MHDQKAWALTVARLYALRTNLPHSITEARVADYHGILNSLESVSEEDFSSFRIPRSDMQREASGIPFAGRHQRKITYSTELFGDDQNFKLQVEGAYHYVQSIELSRRGTDMSESKDLWSLSDYELEMVGRKHNIGGYGDQTGKIDRESIISQVLARRKALQPENPAVHHTVNVNSMSGSVIQQDSNRSNALAETPTPARFSLRTIMEGVIASLLAAGLIVLIHHIWHP